MNGLPYYKAYPRDFIEGTIGMSFELKGAYRLVLDLIYMQGGNLPDDARYISGLLGCTVKKWKTLRQQLVDMGKITVGDGVLSNDRAIIELETLAKLQDKQRENASGPRKNKGLQKPRPNHTESESDINPLTPLKGDDGGGSQSETFRERILSAMGADPVSGMIGASGKTIGRPWDMEHAAGWLRLGLSEAEVVKVIADICDGRSDAISSFKYFDQPMRRMADAKAGTPAKAATPEARPDRPKLPLVKVGEIEGRPVYGDPNNYGGDLTQQGLSQKARDILAAQAAQPKEANNG